MNRLICFSEEKERIKKYLEIKDINDMYFLGHVDQFISNDIFHVAINFSPAYPFSRALMCNYQESGRKTILFLDGIFDYENAFNNPKHTELSYIPYVDVVEDTVVCLGGNSRKFIEFLHKDKLVISYTPLFIHRAVMKEVKSIENRQFNFLITTANTAYFSDDEFDRLLKLLMEVKSFLESSGYTLCYRVYDKKLAESLSVSDDVNFIQGDLHSVAKKVDAIITTPSTLAIECMIWNLPVATLLYRDSPPLNLSGWTLFSNVNFTEVFNTMLNRDNSRMIYQASIVESYVNSDIGVVCDEKLNKIINQTKLHEIKKDKISSVYRDLLYSKYNFNFIIFIKKLKSLLKAFKG